MDVRLRFKPYRLVYCTQGGRISRLISSAERIQKAYALIRQARDLPLPPPGEGGKYNFSYIARVKALLQDARDLVKYISKTPTATPELKEEVRRLLQEADRANREILIQRPDSGSDIA